MQQQEGQDALDGAVHGTGGGGRQALGALSVLVSGLLLVFAVAALATAVVKPINRLTRPSAQLTVPVTDDKARDAVAGVLQAPLQGLTAPTSGNYLDLDGADVSATLHAFDAPTSLKLLTEAPGAVTNLSFAVGALVLWRLLRTIRRGRPFDPGNSRGLVLLAAVVLVGGYAQAYLAGQARGAMLDHLHLTGSTSPFQATSTSLDLTPLVLAGALLALAQAFRAGRTLTDDVAGLV